MLAKKRSLAACLPECLPAACPPVTLFRRWWRRRLRTSPAEGVTAAFLSACVASYLITFLYSLTSRLPPSPRRRPPARPSVTLKGSVLHDLPWNARVKPAASQVTAVFAADVRACKAQKRTAGTTEAEYEIVV